MVCICLIMESLVKFSSNITAVQLKVFLQLKMFWKYIFRCFYMTEVTHKRSFFSIWSAHLDIRNLASTWWRFLHHNFWSTQADKCITHVIPNIAHPFNRNENVNPVNVAEASSDQICSLFHVASSIPHHYSFNTACMERL